MVEGGKRLIRVTDDGEGMTRADAQLACQRFATSKLSSTEDLLSISTFGFRGEALPSIAAVSKFRLITAKKDQVVMGSMQQFQSSSNPASSNLLTQLGSNVIHRDGQQFGLASKDKPRIVRQCATLEPIDDRPGSAQRGGE